METFLSLTSAVAAVAAAAVSIIVYRNNRIPDIISYLVFDRDHQQVSIVVENRGNGVARNIRFDNFDASLVKENIEEHFKSSFVSRGISMLVPGDRREAIVNYGDMGYSEKSVNDIVVEYEYKGLFRWSRAKRTFTLDYYSFAGALFTKSDLREISNSLKNIENSCKAIAKCHR